MKSQRGGKLAVSAWALLALVVLAAVEAGMIRKLYEERREQYFHVSRPEVQTEAFPSDGTVCGSFGVICYVQI